MKDKEIVVPKRQRKIYGANNIKRYLQQAKPDHSANAETSLAGKEHSSSREIERNKRREAKR